MGKEEEIADVRSLVMGKSLQEPWEALGACGDAVIPILEGLAESSKGIPNLLLRSG